MDAVDVTQKWPEPCKQSHEAELRVGNGTWLSKLVSLLRRVVVGGDGSIMVSVKRGSHLSRSITDRFIQEVEIQGIVCEVVPLS